MTVAVVLQGTVPDQLPSVEEAVQVVAFVVTSVSVRLFPWVTVVVDGVSVAVGAGAFTVTVTLALALPPAFVAVMVYVSFPVAGGVTEAFPVRLVLVVRPGPDTVALVAVLPALAFHVIIVDCPCVMTMGAAVIVGDGGSTAGGLMVIVVDPVTFVYPGTVDAAVMVAVVIAVSVEEAVNTPVDVIVPAVAGLAVHVTAWLGLSWPWTVAVHVLLCPAVNVVGVQDGVTEVTVVVLPPPVLPVGLPPQLASAKRRVKATPRQNSLDA